MHKGGIADKAGNRYEARWLTHQLLGLLDGTVQSITIEALGDNEQGFEFSLERIGGTEWHQCKRQTASGTWSIPILDAAGVLAAFRIKTRAIAARCLFISSDPAPQLKLLQDKLPSTHNLEAFEASLSKSETQQWGVLKERFGGDSVDAFRFLKGSEFRTLSEHDLAENLRARITYWFKGDPDSVAARFRAWLEEEKNFNRPIGYDEVTGFLSGAGIETKQYELDRALPGRIRDATSSYVESYPALGAGLYRIERSSVDEVLAGVRSGADVVLLAGAAGMGKSAVIADVINRLQRDGTLTLAFRVDQAGAIATFDELGAHIVGTADNPVVILEQLAAGNRAVLIVDQADAVSEVSGRMAELRRIVLDLIRKSSLYPRVQIIFACRSFDLENDHAYREIAAAEDNVRVDIGPLARAEIDPVLAKLGVSYSPDNSRLMALLALPIGLTLAATLAQSGISDLRRVEHLSQLYERLLQTRDREIQGGFRPGWSIYAPLTTLAAAMSERQDLVAPSVSLDGFAGSLDLLQRAGLIVVRGQRIGFIHESLFDYLYARAFVQERKPIIDFLLSSEQTLFRRTQTRQILSLERELETTRYLDDLQAILSDTRIRPHIRETVVRWLATVPDPTFGEWELIARYAECDRVPRKASTVIFARRSWFELLRTNGLLDVWLACDGDDLSWALDFLRSVAPVAPVEVAVEIDSFLERRPDRVRDAFAALRYIAPKTDARPLADSLIAALNHAGLDDWESDGNDWDDYYAPWIEPAPQEAARIFGALLSHWFRLNPEGHPFKNRYEDGGSAVYWLKELAEAAPLAFLEQVLPFMRVAMDRTRRTDEWPAEDDIWFWRRWDRTDVRSVDLIDIVRHALAEVARSDPAASMRLLRNLEPELYMTGLHLLLETVAANPQGLRDLLVEQIDNPGLFKAGWHSADGHSAGLAIAAAIPWLTEAERGQSEAVIFALQPEIALAKRALVREKSEVDSLQSPYSIKGYTSFLLNNSGKREWSVPTIPRLQ